MTTVTYPSEQCPGPLTVELDIPEDWKTLPVPAVAVATMQAQENAELIGRVFAALAREKPAGVRYQVLRAEDGVSFTHVVTLEDGLAANPVTSLAEFDPSVVDMLTIVLFGASTSRALRRGDGRTIAYTPRGYERKAGSETQASHSSGAVP